MAELVLYSDAFWISPYSFSAFVALTEKGLPFRVEEMKLQEKATRAPAYRARALTGKVPALVDGDFWLTESSAIVEYLEDAHPSPPVLPSDARGRARARQVMSWLRTEMNPLRDDRSTSTMFYAHTDAPLSPAGAACAVELVRIGEALVGDRETIAGGWSIADADLAFMLHRLILNGDPVGDRLARYAAAQWARPSVRKFVERERAPYVPY